MALNVLWVFVGVIGLFAGGHWLVKGAARLAASLGVAPLIIGLTVVAFGTSTPELLVSLDAALRGSSDIAIGNVVGSNIANIGLILGVGGVLMVIPIHIRMIRREIPVAILVVIAMTLMALDGEISRLDGLLMLAGLIVFTVVLVRAVRQERLTEPEEQELEAEEEITGPISRPAELARVVVGLIVLLIGANRLVEGSVAIARELGVSELVIGITLVAVGTSLPELVTAIIAAIKKHDEILFGNVIGSNIFNVLAILAITAVVRPVPVASGLIAFELPVMLLFSIALVLFTLRRRLARLDGALLLAGYAVFIAITLLK